VALSVYLSAVNQKLLFARQLLAMLDGQTDTHKITAVAQSVAVQLYQAWHWHLQDVASNYKLADPEQVQSAAMLVELLEADGKYPAEAMEMLNLDTDNGSWLRELIRAHGQVYLLPVIRKAEMDVDRLPMIAVDAVAADGTLPVDWSLSQAGFWLDRMQELVDRQRDMMVEF
jgi:hypothetical protein